MLRISESEVEMIDKNQLKIINENDLSQSADFNKLVFQIMQKIVDDFRHNNYSCKGCIHDNEWSTICKYCSRVYSDRYEV